MKAFMIFSIFLSTSTYAQGLSADFKCELNSETSVEITNIDFAKELRVKKGQKSCNYFISSASYDPEAASSSMIINFEQKESCEFSENFKPVKSGFVKIPDRKITKTAFVLALAGQDTLPCEIKNFNKKKLSDRIRNSF